MRKSISRRNLIYLSCAGTLACGLNACKLSGLQGGSGKDDLWRTPPSSTKGLYGFINTQGNWVIEPAYHRWSSFSEEGVAPIFISCYVESQGNSLIYSGIINVSGEWIKEPELGLELDYEFSEGLVGATARKSPEYHSADDMGGYMDTQGNWVIEPKFSVGTEGSVNYFSPANSFIAESYAVVSILTGGDTESNGHYLFGIVNRKGDYLLEPKFGFIDGYFYKSIPSVGLTIATKTSEKDALCGFIDGSGTWAIEPVFKRAHTFIGTYAWAKDAKTELEGTIDPSGAWVIPPQYTYLNPINESYAAAKDPETELVGILDLATGAWVKDPQWRYAWLANSNTYIIAREEKDGLVGVYSMQTGETILEPKYKNISYAKPLSIAQDVESELWGYIDESGEWVIPPQFRYASSFYEGLASVSSNK